MNFQHSTDKIELLRNFLDACRPQVQPAEADSLNAFIAVEDNIVYLFPLLLLAVLFVRYDNEKAYDYVTNLSSDDVNAEMSAHVLMTAFFDKYGPDVTVAEYALFMEIFDDESRSPFAYITANNWYNLTIGIAECIVFTYAVKQFVYPPPALEDAEKSPTCESLYSKLKDIVVAALQDKHFDIDFFMTRLSNEYPTNKDLMNEYEHYTGADIGLNNRVFHVTYNSVKRCIAQCRDWQIM